MIAIFATLTLLTACFPTLEPEVGSSTVYTFSVSQDQIDEAGGTLFLNFSSTESLSYSPEVCIEKSIITAKAAISCEITEPLVLRIKTEGTFCKSESANYLPSETACN